MRQTVQLPHPSTSKSYIPLYLTDYHKALLVMAKKRYFKSDLSLPEFCSVIVSNWLEKGFIL